MRNSSGRPLSSTSWLEIHHEAKLSERRSFAAGLLNRHRPQTIVDIGCGPGLWLDLFAGMLPPDARLIGIDSDEAALGEAHERSQEWAQEGAPCASPENVPGTGPKVTSPRTSC